VVREPLWICTHRGIGADYISIFCCDNSAVYRHIEAPYAITVGLTNNWRAPRAHGLCAIPDSRGLLLSQARPSPVAPPPLPNVTPSLAPILPLANGTSYLESSYGGGKHRGRPTIRAHKKKKTRRPVPKILPLGLARVCAREEENYCRIILRTLRNSYGLKGRRKAEEKKEARGTDVPSYKSSW